MSAVIGIIPENSIGLAINIAVADALSGTAVDLTSVTGISFVFVDPAGNKTTRVGSVSGTPTAGTVKYVTVSGDINSVGYWALQVVLAFSGGKTLYTSPAQLRVKGNL